MSGSISPVSPGKYIADNGILKKVVDNVNLIKQKVTEITDGQGNDTASDIGTVTTKLKSVGILDSNGNVQQNVTVEVYISDGAKKIDDVDGLSSVATPHLKLKVTQKVTQDDGNGNVTELSDNDLDFDIKGYIDTIQSHINTLSDDKALLYNVKTAISNGSAYINSTNSDLDSVTNSFKNALNQVKTFIGQLKTEVEELNKVVNGDKNSGKTGFKSVVNAVAGDFGSLKSAAATKIQNILNDSTKTVSVKIKAITDLILGSDTQYGYIDVVAAKKKVDITKTSIENSLATVDSYITQFQTKVNDLQQQYNQLDTSIQVDINGQFKLKDTNGQLLEDNLNKIKNNVSSIMSTGVSYIKAQAALGMAKTLKDVADSIKSALSNFAGDKDPSSMSTSDLDTISSDIEQLKTNIQNAANKLADLNNIVSNGISTTNITTDMQTNLQKISISFTNPFSINPDLNFQNIYKAVDDVKTNGTGYIDTEIKNLTDEITNDQDMISKLNQINYGVTTINNQFVNSPETSKIENLVKADSPNNLENQIENFLPTSQLSYDNFVSTFKSKLDFINQKKQEYEDVNSQLSTLAGELIDAMNAGEDTTPIINQMNQLENQENQILADFQTWRNSLNTMKTNITNYMTQYSSKFDNDSLSDKAVDESVYGLLYLENSLIDKLINAITNTKPLDANGDGSLTLEEVENFLDAVGTAGLSFDLGADLDDVAGADYEIQDIEIPDVTL